MTWFLYAVAANVIWSICNHLDKFLLSRRGGEIGTLIIFSSLFGIFLIVPILIFYPVVLTAPYLLRGAGIFAGLIGMAGIVLYLYALREEEATLVVPWFQLVPIFAYLYGFLFLGERLSAPQLTGVALVIFGATGLSFDIDSRVPHLKARPILLMVCSAFFLAGTVTLFKYISIQTDYWTANFWSTVGEVGSGFLFLLVTRFREQFLEVFRSRVWRVFSANALNETLNLGASLLFRVSILSAPVALVSAAVTGLQPFLVFASGILITVFMPRLGRENLTRKHLVHRGVFLLITFIGTAYLNL
ncbi:EamA family transporter [Candidatus Uhrbacteria bacterium]|nr:EamA family transporter [Candidatus Uhrbacteria bacterium]